MDLQKLIKYADSPENSRIRTEIWGDFVGWDNRRRGENGFLINQLKKNGRKKVLDVALGDGVDTIYLLQQGFDVSSNELDDAFRKKAIENARQSGFNINPTSLDWRQLSKTYSENSFDSVICLGNSLTCVFGREDQLKALREFYSVLRPGGGLIIDERNYQRILDNKEAAVRGELRSTSKYLYTGTKNISAGFVHIADDSILIEYTDKRSGQRSYYHGYPFKKGEMKELLTKAGFSSIEQYSDYELGENPDADFYQYVCIK